MKKVTLFFLTLITASAFSQSVVVLPQNGSNGQSVAPQGAFRYQRQFYLITQSEMIKAGFNSGMNINSIGFTIGEAQNDTARGNFKVYLQNTANNVSRTDTNWTTASTPNNYYNLNGLTPGNYEWQIQSVCAGTSVDSANAVFTNSNLTNCNQPTNFTADNITTSTATLHWVAPASANVTNYVVQYKTSDSVNWIIDTVNATSKNLTGLVPGKNYIWNIKTLCSGGSSDQGSASFITETIPAGCNLTTGLSTSSITSTSATLSWNAAAGASYYSIQYRRSGTYSWFNNLSFTTSANLAGLKAGTTYEWKVRTVCGGGNGAFVAGVSFTTTGTTACYAPAGLSADSLTDSTAVLSWISTGATSYTIRYRLKNHINWTNAISPMTLVRNDSITIPESVGAFNIPLTTNLPFNYNGGGVYVAFEFSDSAGTLPTANTALCTSQNTSILSLGAHNQNSLPSVLTSTNLRPETRFGSPAIADSVEVSNVYALGKVATGFGTPTSVSALVKNHSLSSQTYNVNLSIKDQATNVSRFTDSQSITVPGDSIMHVIFASWSPSLLETDSIIVSINPQPGENYLLNNSSYYLEKVNGNLMSFDDGSARITSAGFDTLPGLILCRYRMNGCGRVNSAQVYLSNSAKNHPLYAVLLNSSGSIVDTSAHYIADSSEVNTYRSFYFPLTPFFTNEDYYIGLAQTADTVNGYFPVGVQWEGTDIRDSAYYRANLNGTGIINNPAPGRLMISAEVIFATPTVKITGKLSLCPSSTDTLVAQSTNTRFANSVIGFSSQNSKAQFSALQSLGTPNVYPANVISSNSWVSSTADAQREYLTLGFSNAAPVNFIDIYENYNAGAVDTVYVKNPGTNNFDVVYTGSAAAINPAAARINRITFPLTSYNVSEVRLAINSPAVSGYNAIDAVSTGAIDDSAYQSVVNYLWSTGATTKSIFVTSAGNYTVTATDTNTCAKSASVTIFNPTIITPTITADRPTTFCVGDTAVKLTSSQLTGNLWSTGATTRTITASTSGNYTVSYNDGTGCGVTTSAPIVVTVNALPVVSVTGNLAFCPGASTTLNAGSGYSAYVWSTGSTAQTISVNTAGAFSVTATNGNGCKGKKTVVTSVSPVPSPSISGNSFFCPGSSITLNGGSGYTQFSWSTGATTQTIQVNNAATYTVTVTNGNGCTGSTNAATHLFVPPTPFISGNSSFCSGGSAVITANTGYASYNWSTGVTTQSLTITTGATFTVTVTDGNGCTGTATRAGTIFTPPSPVISGNLSFCNGGSTVLDAGIGYPVYNWSTGDNTHAVNVSAVGTYTVSVTDNNGCTGSTSAATTLSNATPAIPGAITGQTTGLCNAASKTFSIVPVATATYYQWTVPAGDSILSGQGTTSINVIFNSFNLGFISVVASNTCGQSLPQTLQLNGAPAAPGAISGPDVVCRQNGKVYSIAAVTGATSYTWTVPVGVTIASGQGTTSVTVNFGTGFTSTGSICVRANNSCGQSALTCFTVVTVPPVPGTITGPITSCKKQAIVPYSIAAVSGASSYNWAVPPSAKVSTGQGTTSVLVTFGTQAGNVSVRAANVCGNSLYKTLAITFNCRQAGDGLNLIQDFNAYPNPTAGKLTITFDAPAKEQYVLKVYDVLGKVLMNEPCLAKEGNNMHELDLSMVAKGMYFLRMEKEGEIKASLKIAVE